MGARVLASVFYVCFLLTQAQGKELQIETIPIRLVRQTQGLDVTKGLLVGGGIHSAVPSRDNPDASATTVYKFSTEDARNVIPYNPYEYGQAQNYEEDARYKEFASIEAETGGYNNENEYLDTTGYNYYKTATSFNLEGPRQLETITTQSFHKEVEPYDTSGFQKSHKEGEERAEVHYHQHKHLHKHSHKQEHVHKHQQEHKHDHGHQHSHHAQHEHKHDAQHKHVHHSEHKHNHKGGHHHKHEQKHKHSHHAEHKHGHKHRQDHKHNQRHDHKHSHHQEHKHSHHQEHKHHHRHGHKHQSQHKHKHEHYGHHKHEHGHKGEHKHQHHSRHDHKYSYHKY